MKTRIAALALLGALSLAPLARAQAANPVLAVVDRLCIPNHAESAKVLAAAKAEGWGPVDAVGVAMIGDRYKTISVTIVEKSEGGSHLLLIVGEDPINDRGRAMTTHRCWVESDQTNSTDMVEALTSRFGPPQETKGVTAWVLLSDGGKLRSITAQDSAGPGTPVTLVMTSPDFKAENVAYNEMRP